jgi:hypothetical protein
MTYRFTRFLAANVRAKPQHPARKEVDAKSKGPPYFTDTTLALKLGKTFNVVEKKKTDNLAQIVFSGGGDIRSAGNAARLGTT